VASPPLGTCAPTSATWRLSYAERRRIREELRRKKQEQLVQEMLARAVREKRLAPEELVVEGLVTNAAAYRAEDFGVDYGETPESEAAPPVPEEEPVAEGVYVVPGE
jgi:S-methylmethionine-dependent homocysteine/selenocysteine methylase